VAKLPGILGGTGSDAAVVVTEAGLAATRVVARVTSVLDAAGIPVMLFSGVQPAPTTGDLAAGADAVAATGPARARVALVAVGGGSPIDTAKGSRSLP
jgi:alcohol dehydrogenase class IV